MKYPDVIPYNARAYSQMSVAKYYGGIKLGGEEYILDYENCKKEIRDGEQYFFPDLVKLSTIKPKKKEKAKSKQGKLL